MICVAFFFQIFAKSQQPPRFYYLTILFSYLTILITSN